MQRMMLILVVASGCEDPEEPVPVAPLPIDGTHYGQTYAQWGASWWQWTFSQPATGHPVLDETGADCGGGQQDPVWFLAGTFGSAPVERTCVVPAEQALLFPIVNLAIDNGGVPEDDWMTDTEIQDALTGALDTATGLYATLDGESLGEPLDFRTGIQPFSYTLPASDSLYELWGLVEEDGVVDPSFTDGYYMLLDPLPPGEYELSFGGTLELDPSTPDDDFSAGATYLLQIE
jgi:hypothetical protein